jgi:RNA polymerase sigma-70 factor (ECF subfamily)
MKSRENQFIPTRESLLSRLKNWDDQESWREFFALYRRLTYSAAAGAGLSPQEADDVVQETMISVAKSIKEFKYDPKRCSFKTWLGQLTQRRIADHYRKRYRQKNAPMLPDENSASTAPVNRIPDPNSASLDEIWDAAWKKELYATALERIKTQVSPEQFQIFDFYVLRNMPVAKVAAALETNSASVYLAKHRISKLLKKEIQTIEAEMG